MIGNYKKPRYAKAYGVKSNLYVNNIIYTTSFGNKNESVISKETDSITYKVKEIDENSSFDLKTEAEKLNVSLKKSKNSGIAIGNPKVNSKADIININPKILKQIFGTDIVNDNIHIQIAYNILDMNKIISLYYYNVVYAINNLARDNDIDIDEDFIGNLTYTNTLEHYNPYIKEEDKKNYTYSEVLKEAKFNPKGFYLFDKYAKSSYPYFSIFEKYKDYKTKDENGNKLSEEKIENNKQQANKENEPKKKYNFNLLRILSYVRQSIAHSKEANFNSLYKINNKNDLPQDLVEIINDKLAEDLKGINDNFSQNARRNLWILKQIFDSEDDNTLLRKYYKFVMVKENRNIGINVNKVRESLFDYYYDTYGINIRSNNHDSYRQKINLIYDYVIYYYLKDNCKSYIELLRMAPKERNREEIKNNIYTQIARDFDDKNQNLRASSYDVITEMVAKSIEQDNYDHIVNEVKISNNFIALGAESFNLFAKLIYFISYFLEKKEKNDLITALINKLDNIASLNAIYTKISKKTITYNTDYGMFLNASTMADKLRIIKNLSHMEKKLEKAQGGIYIDVLRSLGYEGSNDECRGIISELENENHPFRNFIVNNIIQSARYKYIVKYINPKYCKNYIGNENLIKYILNDIPSKQLDRYFCRITKLDINSNVEVSEKIDTLYKRLRDVTFENLNSNYNPEYVEDSKSLVQLYYTVIYLAVKNLVNINSVFTIGFECLERDYAIVNDLPSKDVYDSKSKELFLIRGNTEKNEVSNSALEFYKKKNKHNYEYLNENVNEFDSISKIGDIFAQVRNNVIHMNIVRNAHKYFTEIELDPKPTSEIGNYVPVYYDLYAYVLERMILDQYPDKIVINGKNYYETVKSHYDKDLLKILFIPFAYNLARYKNLTIRDLFYDQYKYLKESKN